MLAIQATKYKADGKVTHGHYICDLLAKNCKFLLPHFHLTLSLGVNPFEFLDEFFIAITGVRYVRPIVTLNFDLLKPKT